MQRDERGKPHPSFSQWSRHLASEDGGKGTCICSPSLPTGTDSRDVSPAISLGQLVLTFMHRKLLKMHLQTLGMVTEVWKAGLSQAARAACPHAQTWQRTWPQNWTQSMQPRLTWEKHGPDQHKKVHFPSKPPLINVQEYDKQKQIPSVPPSPLLFGITCPLFPTATVFFNSHPSFSTHRHHFSTYFCLSNKKVGSPLQRSFQGNFYTAADSSPGMSCL